MTIIVGLGNPGEQFKHTRHNAGFMALDFFAKEHDFPPFELDKKSNSLIAKEKKVLLAKPQTFMNESGKAVKKIVSFAPGGKTSDVVLVHDDIDLPVGKIKIIKNRGSAGHKGVESVIKAIGNKNLVRVRVGIAPAKGKSGAPEKFVVKDFSDQEHVVIKKTIKKIAQALELLLEKGTEQAMNEFNR